MSVEERKILSVVSHGALLLSGTLITIAIPIIILVITEDPVVKGNAKESLNFFLNFIIYFFIFGILSFVAIGIPFFIALLILSAILPIFAMVKVLTNPDKPYRYPFVIHYL